MLLRDAMQCAMVGGTLGSEEISLRHCVEEMREEQGGLVRSMTGVKIKWRNFCNEGDNLSREKSIAHQSIKQRKRLSGLVKAAVCEFTNSV